MSFERYIQGIREAVMETTCADCDWRLSISGLDKDAVVRAMQVAFADHRRSAHSEC